MIKFNDVRKNENKEQKVQDLRDKCSIDINQL